MNAFRIVGMLLGFAVLASGVRADPTNYVGGDCAVDHGQYASEYQYSSGIVTNVSSTTNRTFTCPAARINSSSSTAVSSAWFYVIDRHSTYNVSCTLWSRASDNGAAYTSSASSSGNSGSYQKLTYGTSLNALTDSTIHFSCTVPLNPGAAESGLVGYQIDEGT